jgi:teichuronic acid exporter
MSADRETRRRLAGNAVRGGVVLLAARLGMQAFTWAVTLTVPRLIGARDFGVMTWGFLFLGLVEILAEAGLGRALVQKQEPTPDDKDRVFTLSLAFAAALYLLLFLFADCIALFVRLPEFAFFLRVLALSVWLVPFRSVSLAILDREQRLGSQALAHVLMAGLQSTLVLVLALSNFGYWSLAIGAMVGKLVEAASLHVAAGWSPRLRWPGSESRELISFGLYAAGGSLLWFLYDNADYAIVGRLFGPAELGLYSLAFLLMTLPVQKLTANVSHVAYPVFCRLQDDRPRLKRWFLRLSVLVGVVGVPALVGLALVADDAIGLVYGGPWLRAVGPFRLLAFVGVVRLYAAMLPHLYNAIGRPDVNLRYTAACVVVLPVAFTLGGTWGRLEGVCLAWLIVYPLTVVVLMTLTRPILGFGVAEFVAAQVPVFGATMSMAGAVLLARLWMEPGPIRLAVCVAVGVVTYALIMTTLARDTVLADVRALWRELRGGAG